MKNLSICFTILSLIGCSNQASEDFSKEVEDQQDTINLTIETIPADSLIHFFTNAQFSDNPNIHIEQGNKTVFYYKYSPEKIKECADCGSTTIIQFEIDLNDKESFQTNELESTKFTYERFCFCDMPDSTEKYENTGELIISQVSDTSWQAEIIFRNILDEDWMESENYSDTIRTVFLPFKPYCQNEDGTNCYDKFGRKTGKWKVVNSTEIKEGTYSRNLFTGTRLLHATGKPQDTTRLLIFENGIIVSEIDNRKRHLTN